MQLQKQSTNIIVGFNTKFGTRYAFIDFENVKCIHDAFHIIPQRKFFGVKLQVRYRYDKLSVPNFDIPNRQGPVKGFTGDNLTVKLCDLPPSMNKAELELHLGPVSPYLKIKVLTRAVDRKSSAFVTFATREMAQAAVQYLRKNSFLKNRQPLEIEYPAHDSTETDLDKKTVHITNLPHNVNKVFNIDSPI